MSAAGVRRVTSCNGVRWPRNLCRRSRIATPVRGAMRGRSQDYEENGCFSSLPKLPVCGIAIAAQQDQSLRSQRHSGVETLKINSVA